jgi:hypothetical protein
MSLHDAVLGVLFAGLLLVFCVCAFLLREIMVLRERTDRLTRLLTETGAGGHAAQALADVRIPSMSGGWLLAVDSGCSLCHEVVEALGASAGDATVLLTYDDPSVWTPHWSGEVRADRALWSELAPLTPPTLLHVDTSGRIDTIRLPMNGAEALAIVTATAEADRGAIHYA